MLLHYLQVNLKYKEALKSHANSLKKAIRQIIEHVEKGTICYTHDYIIPIKF